jgi:hypothetical protein
MSHNFEVLSLTAQGARTLLIELLDVLSDRAVLDFVDRFELHMDEHGCPCAVVPAKMSRFGTEDLIYLDFDDVEVSTAVAGEDYL